MNIEAALKRLKQFKDLETDREIAKTLGLSPSNFAARKKRDSLFPAIVDWALKENVSLDWLIKGEGDQLIDNASEPPPDYHPPSNIYRPVNIFLLSRCLEMLENRLDHFGLSATPDQKARMAAVAYDKMVAVTGGQSAIVDGQKAYAPEGDEIDPDKVRIVLDLLDTMAGMIKE